MKGLIKLVAGCLILFCACDPKRGAVNPLPQRLDSLFATVPDFSGVALIADKGKPIYHKAFGYLNFETRVPMDTSSIFELASVSKQFTSMLIMMLKERGQLQYDDPVDKYILHLPYPGITLRHLLNHTSGLPEYETLMQEHWDKTQVASNSDILEYLVRYHPARNFEPGTRYKYNNTGYVLLGTVIEKITGRDFVALCHELIFDPIKMTKTDLRTPAQKQGLRNFAWGHIAVPEKHKYLPADSFPASNYVYYLGNRKGPGRISSTSSDLLAWDRALYTEKLVKKESLLEAFTPSQAPGQYDFEGYGFGWMLDHDALGRKIRHSGDNPGYRTHILRYVDTDKTVILLCNNQFKEFKDVLKGIEAIIRKR